MVSQLGESTRGGYPHGDRDARPAEYAGAYLLRHGKGVGNKRRGEAHEALVDGILLHLTYHAGHRGHDTLRKVAVELVIGREDHNAMLLEQGAGLEFRFAHGNTKGLGLLTARYDTAIVIGEHHHGLASEVRSEEPFTGNVEVIAVDE